jgi:5'-nucleotidase
MKSKGYYVHLKPYDNAIELIKSLTVNFDIYFVTACPAPNMYAFSEKAEWIEHHFGPEYVSKLIICKDKFLVNGDVLIDDKPNITNDESSWIHLLYSQPYNEGVFTWTSNQHVLFDLLKGIKKENCTLT